MFNPPRVYRNINHESYNPDETQFDPDMATEDHGVTSPTPDQLAKHAKGNNDEEVVDAAAAAKARQNKDKRERDGRDAGSDEEEEGKRSNSESDKKQQEKLKDKKQNARDAGDDDRVGAGSRRGSSSSQHGAASGSVASATPIDSATDGVFSQLLLESILSTKSVADFIGGLPDKRGPLLVRFPTTLLGKSWKKRYFTLHGDCLYFHEDQSFIHPSSGAGAGMGGSLNGKGVGVNYDKCKKIDIADFWIIQQDGGASSGSSSVASSAPLDSAVKGIPAAAVAAAAAAAAAMATGSNGEKVYGGGQPIPTDQGDADADRGDGGNSGSSATPRTSKFDELFKSKGRGGDKPRDKKDSGSFGAGGGKDGADRITKERKEEGPVVRGRRRSSVVLDAGAMVILLISKEKGPDPIELTGLNEGTIADLATLHEWVQAINARIALLNFLHSPISFTAMARGGREILAFLTDASCHTLKIANKFTDLAPMLSHFAQPLQHRSHLSISFTNCAMTDEALIALAEILAAAPSIIVDRLDLSRNLLTRTSMGALHRALKANTNIRTLVLDQNQIGDAGLDLLMHGESGVSGGSATPSEGQSSFWSRGMALQSVSLAQNQISDRGLEVFVHSVVQHLEAEAEGQDASAAPSALPFELLDFSGNQITDLGVQVLSALLQRNPHVRSVNLQGNFITDSGAASLRDVLASERSSVASLNLAANQLSSAGLGFLVDALAANPLQRKVALDLSGNPGLDESGLAKLLALKAERQAPGRNVWAVNITSLAFSVYDDEVIAQRLAATQSGAAAVLSPRQRPNRDVSQSPPAVGALSSSQQNVLNLFSPIVIGAGARLQYPLSAVAASNSAPPPKLQPDTPAGAVQPSNAMLDTLGLSAGSARAASGGAAGTSTPASADSSPATSGKKKSKLKGAKKNNRHLSGNDPLAPRIAISESKGVQPKLSIQPLHPPPQFTEPAASPDAHSELNNPYPISHVIGSDLHGAPSAVHGSTLPASNPSHPTPIAHDDEDETPNALLPGAAR